MTYEMAPEQHTSLVQEWFKQESLGLLREQLRQQRRYPGYPEDRLTWSKGVFKTGEYGRLYLPHGKWHMLPGEDDYIDANRAAHWAAQGMHLDTLDRPLHPWINDLLAEDIGVITGKGFYYHWGVNQTADPIIIRTDTEEPQVLLIQRNDTGQWALPGGFLDPEEQSETAAFREAWEETGVNWEDFNPSVSPVYSGPMADLRLTANAWPETTAYRLLLDPARTYGHSTESFRGNPEEVKAAAWMTKSQATQGLFGSHKLLVELAFQEM